MKEFARSATRVLLPAYKESVPQILMVMTQPGALDLEPSPHLDPHSLSLLRGPKYEP